MPIGSYSAIGPLSQNILFMQILAFLEPVVSQIEICLPSPLFFLPKTLLQHWRLSYAQSIAFGVRIMGVRSPKNRVLGIGFI